jgi:hypothetical protein
VELAGVPSGLQSQAYSITHSGRIVGQVFNDDFSLQRAVFWQNANSALVYLPQLSSAFPHSVATGINDGAISSAMGATQIPWNAMLLIGPAARALRWRSPRPEGNLFIRTLILERTSTMRAIWWAWHITPITR